MRENYANNDIKSIRIVSVDSYMKYPVNGLDPCYSEFRGNEIKQVPVIRIFGTDSDGIKTCMHVHAVFPYLYIPFDAGDDLINCDSLSYQLASSLDRAINISLGQAHSTAQHVFKVILVKGIPFYGYHRNEHQFLKIFFYNPAFIRRASNLLQNGAILGKIYQPHESHVPYILQFLIDFNLYGMSFLYVPSDTIRYRLSDDDQQNASLVEKYGANRVLDKRIERITVCKQEIDIVASSILNRIQLISSEKEECANPGIAFLWMDERNRRKKFGDEMPSLHSTQKSETRKTYQKTESELFHQAALEKRIALSHINGEIAGETSLNDTALGDLTQKNKNQSKFFDQYTSNAVYPAECDQLTVSSESISDASYIIDHLTQRPVAKAFQRKKQLNLTTEINLDDTIVNEEIIMNLSQMPNAKLNETLNDEECDVLDALRQLEEEEEQQENRIENDSILAPFSQPKKGTLALSLGQHNRKMDVSFGENGEELGDKNEQSILKRSFADDYFNDSDDDILNDFSMSLDTFASKSLQSNDASDWMKIPQIDGAYDTPKKKSPVKRSLCRSQQNTALRSASKYLPLDIRITKPLSTLNVNLDNGIDEIEEHCYKRSKIGIESESPVIEFSQRSGDSDDKKNYTEDISTSISSNTSENLRDKIRNQTPETDTMGASAISETNDSRNNCNLEEYKDILSRAVCVKLTKYRNIEEEYRTKQTQDRERSPTPESTPSRRYPVRNRTASKRLLFSQSLYTNNLKESKVSIPKSKPAVKTTELDFLDSYREWSKCEVAYRYDKSKNFFPDPGPSTVNYYEDIDIPGYYEPLKKPTRKGRPSKMNMKRSSLSKEEYYDMDSDDLAIQSFYEESFMRSAARHDSPVQDVDATPKALNKVKQDNAISTPEISKLVNAIKDPLSTTDETKWTTSIITPIIHPPSLSDVKRALNHSELPKVVNAAPHYGDPLDLSVATNSKIEIGDSVLQIAGVSLNDCEEFKSQLDLVGLDGWRKRSVGTMISTARGKNNTSFQKSSYARKFLASEGTTVIVPSEKPPTRIEVTSWLEVRSLLNARNHAIKGSNQSQNESEEDSPFKIRPEKLHSIILHSSQDDIVTISLTQSSKSTNSSQSQKKNNANKQKLQNGQYPNVTLRSVRRSGIQHNAHNSDSDDDVICLDDIPNLDITGTSKLRSKQQQHPMMIHPPLNGVRKSLVSTAGRKCGLLK